MDLKQLEYIVKIADEKNVSRAAEKLFISQSALNQQLLKLEKDLGAPLFFRTRNNWQLTEVGEIYVRTAREILGLKESAYNQIADVLGSESRHFTLGIAPGRGIRMFTHVYPKFLEKFPGVSISPIEMSSYRQQSLIADEKLDLGFLTIGDSQKINSNYHTIYSEEIFVALPTNHPLSKSISRSPGQIPEIELSALQDEPFVLMYPGSSCRFLTDAVFGEAGITPNVLFETSNARSIAYFVSSGLCCGFIPEFYALERNDISLFALPSHPHWDVAFCYSKRSYLSKPLKEFIRLCSEYWTEYYQQKRPVSGNTHESEHPDSVPDETL